MLLVTPSVAAGLSTREVGVSDEWIVSLGLFQFSEFEKDQA